MIEFMLLVLNGIFYIGILFLRYRFKLRVNQWLVAGGSLLFTFNNAYILGFEHLYWLALFTVFMFAAAFRMYGAVSSALGMLAILYYFSVYPPQLWWWMAAGYLIFSLSAGGMFYYFSLQEIKLTRWQTFFYKQSRNLHVIREVSLALQSTLKLDKVMHIFLTAVTAGYGLGYNRALIFLQDEENERTFTGRLGIGPLGVNEGHQIWENVVNQKLTLKDFIKLQREAEMNDQELNRLVRSLSFDLDGDSSLCHYVLAEKDPVIVIDKEQESDSFVRQMRKLFQMREFAVIPLLTRGTVTGIMVIDNIVDKKPIQYDDLDNIMPLATQGAIAMENAMLYKKTENMAIEDALTGLKNKRFMDRMVPHLAASAKSNSTPLTALVLDIDFFKQYNDTHGHLKGNDVLKDFGKLLLISVSEEDIVCRFGGEEFVILMPKTALEEGIGKAEKIRNSIREYPFEGCRTQPGGAITASIGLSSFPETVTDCEFLIHTADEAVYSAKKNGRDQVSVYSAEESGVISS